MYFMNLRFEYFLYINKRPFSASFYDMYCINVQNNYVRVYAK